VKPRHVFANFFVVARETFGGIDVGGEKDGVLVKVSVRRRGEKQQDESNQECGEKNEAMARVRERHGSPFAEGEDLRAPGSAEG
jgi:hypothetical protein